MSSDFWSFFSFQVRTYELVGDGKMTGSFIWSSDDRYLVLFSSFTNQGRGRDVKIREDN